MTRVVEAWGDDVPDGKVNDFRGAVKAKDDEVVVFSWFEYPSKAARDAANHKIMTDPRMKAMGEQMPFDGQRMMSAASHRSSTRRLEEPWGMPTVSWCRCRRATRRPTATPAKAAAVFQDHGATRVVEAWADDVPDGTLTDYKRAVLAKDGEKVVYSWIEWPSKEARDEGWKKVMDDERMKRAHDTMPFDGRRMIYGGFAPILDA